MGVGNVVLTVLNVVLTENFGNANVVIAFPLVEGDFSEELLLVMFELSHDCYILVLLVVILAKGHD